MMRRIVVIVLLVFACVKGFAQEPVDAADFYNPFEADFREIVVDTTLFYSPLGDGETLFGVLSRFGFLFTSYNPRGLDERFSRVSVAGLELSSGIGKYPDYGLYTALATSSPQSSRHYADFPAGFITPLETDQYDVRASSASPGTSATYTYSEKRYRTGLRLRSAGGLGREWYYALSLRGRLGQDAYIDGLFSEELTGSLAVEKRFKKGGSLSLFAIAAPQRRGLKGWTEREAYELTDNRYYNPYWGVFEGRVRNSRVRRDLTPLFVAHLDIPSAGSERYSVTVGYRFGERSKSGLTWFGAANPAPDYYLNLPGHRAEPHVVDALTKAWRSGDLRVTQLDWAELYHTNLFSDDPHATYIADERVERLNNLQASFSAKSRNEQGFGYEYGGRVRSDRSNFFRRVKDLLGGEYILNRDPFTGLESDLRDPGRKAGVGDLFDYNYDIVRRQATAFGAGHYRQGRWSVTLGAELSLVSLTREGHYEKAGYPGGSSYGASAKQEFTTYSLSLGGSCHFTARHYLAVSVIGGEYEPHYENIFLTPDYGNETIADPAPIRIFNAGLDYRLPIARFIDLEVSGYVMQSGGESSITRYYDDIYGSYCELVMTDIAKFNWGVEAGLKVDITDRLTLMAALSVGNYVYGNNPSMTIIDDATGRVLMLGDNARLNGFVHSATPQTMAVVALNYNTRSQWRFEVEWVFADRRYVTVNPLRRTERVVSLTASPEERLDCIRQERLPAVSVVNIGITKGFTLFGVRVFASVTLNNLLGRGDIIYGGYEQMRLKKSTILGETSYKPFPSRYNYYYSRNILGSLTFSF